MSDKKKKTRWDFLGRKVEGEEELTQKFGRVIGIQPPATPTEEVGVETGEMLYQDLLKKLYEKDVSEIQEEKAIEVKKPNPFINWFHKSSTRMLVGVTGAWILLLAFLFLLLAAFSGDVSFSEVAGALAVFVISGAIWLYPIGYFTAIVVPRMISRLSDKEEFSWVRLGVSIFLLGWHLIYGLLPRKAFERHFYKFTNLFKGIRHGGEGKYRQAIAELEEYKAHKKDFEENYILYSTLGECYFHVGEIDKAISSYQKATNFAPDELEPRLNLATAYILSNQHDEGLSLLRELRKKFPENTEILITMARSYLILGFFDDALDLLMEARKFKPMDPIIHKMLAEVHLGKGMKKEAMESANKAISLNPPPNIAEEAREIINLLI